MAGTQHGAINKHNFKVGHVRIIIYLKKYNTIQNTDRSHKREQSLKVPWESQKGKKKKKEEKRGKKAQPIELRSMFMTDCTSIEGIPQGTAEK